MSEENIEMVRRLYAMLSHGDDALLDLIAPDFVVDFSRRLVDPFVFRDLNPEMFASVMSEALETWDELPAWEPEELIDAGDKVFAFIRTSSRGKASGVEVEAYVANVWTFRDGKPVELKYFGEDRAAAIAAAGLQE
jgi:ketosteroid isomerase-like protein